MRYCCLCANKLPQALWRRQAHVTHRLHSLAPLREATRTAVRFDVTAEPPHGLRAATSVDNDPTCPCRDHSQNQAYGDSKTTNTLLAVS